MVKKVLGGYLACGFVWGSEIMEFSISAQQKKSETETFCDIFEFILKDAIILDNVSCIR